MKIAICGTHGVGKTTLVESLRDEPKFKDYLFDNNVTRWVHSLGFNINEGTSEASQEINMLKRVANLNSFKDIIADRSIIDVLAYSYYGLIEKNVSIDSYNYQLKLVLANLYKYDILFHLKPEFEIEDDGVRATDKDYQNTIASFIDRYIQYFDAEVVELSGSVEERKNKMLKCISIRNFNGL